MGWYFNKIVCINEKWCLNKLRYTLFIVNGNDKLFRVLLSSCELRIETKLL